MNLLHKLVDLILYSSVWIAICAAAQVQLTYLLFDIDAGWDSYTWFIFSATLALYCLHRIIGLSRLKHNNLEGRFAVIMQYRNHILVYAILGLIASGVCLLYLSYDTWYMLVVPVAISIGYVIPIGQGRKRLRDIHYLKLFLIAIAWSLLTVVVPVLSHGEADTSVLALAFAERLFFLIAITLPFDIRDIRIDPGTGLRTIPGTIGIRPSRIMAILAQCVSMAIVLYLIQNNGYPAVYTIPFMIFALVTMALIWKAKEDRHDYYYSGALDGTMLLPYILTCGYLIMLP